MARVVKGAIRIKDKTPTAELFRPGDRVVIQLGYNEKMQEEFIGFVTSISNNKPLEIVCEGYSYQLQQKIEKTGFAACELKNILETIIKGTEIMLADNIPAMKFDSWVINNQNGKQVLTSLKKEFFIDFYFHGKVLHAIMKNKSITPPVKYRTRWNLIAILELKEFQATKKLTEIAPLTAAGSQNPKITASTKLGSPFIIVQNYTTDPDTLTMIRNKIIQDSGTAGIAGKITGFLQPHCIPGNEITIEDKEIPKRSGRYFVQDTEVTYSSTGGRRTIGFISIPV